MFLDCFSYLPVGYFTRGLIRTGVDHSEVPLKIKWIRFGLLIYGWNSSFSYYRALRGYLKIKIFPIKLGVAD